MPVIVSGPSSSGTGTTLSEMRTELRARMGGKVRYLTDSRIDRYLNQGRAYLDDLYYWPYLEASATGVAPLTITDLGEIEAVINTSQNDFPLLRRQFRDLTEWFQDLSIQGSPTYYYTAEPSGNPVVATYPVSATDVIGVQYWSRTPDLVDPSDQPLAPVQWQNLYIDIAQAYAYRAESNVEEADRLEKWIERRVLAMVESLQPGLRDGPDVFQYALDSDV